MNIFHLRSTSILVPTLTALVSFCLPPDSYRLLHSIFRVTLPTAAKQPPESARVPRLPILNLHLPAPVRTILATKACQQWSKGSSRRRLLIFSLSSSLDPFSLTQSTHLTTPSEVTKTMYLVRRIYPPIYPPTTLLSVPPAVLSSHACLTRLAVCTAPSPASTWPITAEPSMVAFPDSHRFTW